MNDRMHNVADPNFEWLPVRKAGTNVLVSLREVLTTGHEIEGLSSDLVPAQKDALIRFLTAMTAAAGACLSDEEFDRFAAAGRLPVERIDNFLLTHHDLFWLCDPITNRPWMQQWGSIENLPDSRAFSDNLFRLEPLRPGPSAHQWLLRDREQRARPVSDPREIALLITVAWFAWSIHSNTASLDKTKAGTTPTRPTSFRFNADSSLPAMPLVMLGNLTFQSGAKDQAFYWIGPSLAMTIVANMPSDWVLKRQALPVWLSQETSPTHDLADDYTGVWRSTFAANRCVLRWEEDRVRVAFTGTPQEFPSPIGVSSVGKRNENAVAVHALDYLRVWQTVTTKKNGPGNETESKNQRLTTQDGGFSTLADLHSWFFNDVTGGDREPLYLKLSRTLQTKVFGDVNKNDWRLASHSYIASQGNPVESRWIEVQWGALFPGSTTPIEFSPKSLAWATGIVRAAAKIANEVGYCVHLVFFASQTKDVKSPLEPKAEDRFRIYAASNLVQLLAGELEEETARRLLISDALRAFDETLSGFDTGPYGLQVAVQRAMLLRRVARFLSDVALREAGPSATSPLPLRSDTTA